LRLDVVPPDAAIRIQLDAGNVFAPSLPGADAGEEEQVANAFGVREGADGFGGTAGMHITHDQSPGALPQKGSRETKGRLDLV
jgi:hypothetical protein